MLRPSPTEHVQDMNRSLLMDALLAKASGDGESFAAGLPEDVQAIVLDIQDSYDSLLSLVPESAQPMILSKLTRIVDEIMVDGWSPTAAQEALVYYEDIPVSPNVFFSDPYYAGEFGEGLYPVNFRDLCWLANPENRIMETILTGSVRWGKSSTGVFLLAYRLYLLALLRDPQTYFGLTRASSIRYGIFSLFKYKTNELEDRLRAVVDQSPYFKDHFPRENQKQSRQLRFPKQISIIVGCVAAGTLIGTPAGCVPVEKLAEASSSVLSWDGHGFVASPYQAVVDKGMQDVYQVRTSDGLELSCTADHMFLTFDIPHANLTYKRLSETAVGDVIYTASTCFQRSAAGPQEISEERIAAIEHAGVQQTFDVLNATPYHNVVTNGIVSHQSTELALLGETLVGALLDEINFMASPKVTGRSRRAAKEELGQAQKLYTALRVRLRAQFVNSPGSCAPYFMCLMSERRAQTDFLEQHILHHGHEPGVAVISRAIWDVQAPGTYSGKTFFVFCGDTLNAARILGPEEPPVDETNTLEAPEEHREDFERNLEDAIRRIGGRATVAASNLFGRPEVIREAFDEKAVHPFTQEEITLSTGDDVELSSYVREDILFRHEMSGLQPRIDQGAHRVMHVDLSSTTASTGIACVHMRTDGLDYKVVVDFMLRVNPPLRISGHEIDFEKIITFIRYLQGNGFVFALVSFDKYQSRHSAQILRKSGTDVAYISVDETDDPYVNLRGLFESHRISMYNYPPVVDELRHLEHDITIRKVFKPASKLKDVADALAGSCYGLIPERSRPRPSKMLETMATSRAGAAGFPAIPIGG